MKVNRLADAENGPDFSPLPSIYPVSFCFPLPMLNVRVSEHKTARAQCWMETKKNIAPSTSLHEMQQR
jgi:hypothetical protein